MIKILVAEDDFSNRMLLTKLLSGIGGCDVVVNGQEAIDAFKLALAESVPYDLICLDIRMPVIDGIDVLKTIRSIEDQSGIGGLDRVKIIMVTGLSHAKHVIEAFKDGCEAYVIKPVEKTKLFEEIGKLGLSVAGQ